MKTIKKLIRKPVEAEYADIHVYDNLDEYINDYNNGKDFVKCCNEWKKTMIDGQNFYSFSDKADEMYLTENVYKELLEHCDKKYSIYERKLFRTRKHLGVYREASFVEASSLEELLDYMNDKNESWLPELCEEINDEIKKLEKEITRIQGLINQLEKDKVKICSEEYLRTEVIEDYIFYSKKYKEKKK